MTGRPDYDAGDLVVCVDASVNPVFGPAGLVRGGVYTVEKVAFNRAAWGCWVAGLDPISSYGFAVTRFRRIDPKPPEFFAGKIETVREDELV